MTSISLGAIIMLGVMTISFYKIDRKTESLFFLASIMYAYLNNYDYSNINDHLNSLIFIFITFSLIIFLRFTLLKKYNKKLF